MAKTRKVIALVLAFMMIFSSVSVLANAFDPASEGGSTLAVTAQILKNDGTEWVACEKVTAGETVKVRVSLSTDYYSNLSDLIFFYDNTFFGDSYETGVQPLTVNDSNFSSSLFTKSASGIINSLLSGGCVTADYLSTHNYFVVSLEGPFSNFMYDGSDWLFEFELNVLSNASGDGVFEVLDSTVQKTTNTSGYFNVPKGAQNEDSSTIYDMSFWYNGTVDCSASVTTDSSITLDPAGGIWTDEGTSVARTFNGTTAAAFTRPELSYEGKTLAGWYDSSISGATLEDCTYGPAGPTEYSADEDIELTAFWIDQVGATFSYNYEGSPADVVDPTATTGYPVGLDLNGNSVVPAVPTREGYEFRGWATDPAASPQSASLLQNFDGMVYGSEGVAYYMIWATEVTVEFFDTKDNSSLGSFNGYAGDPFTATVPAAPIYTGYSNVAGEGNYVPAAPSVFPESDTTYNAIYEANSYIVNYIIYDAQGSNTAVFSSGRNTAYGSPVQTSVRYAVPAGKQLNAWYTDQACTTAFAGGNLESTSGLTLYGYLENETYTVTFDLNGGNIGGDTSSVTQQVAFMGTITAPADPVKDGFIFAGWNPSIIGTSILDVPEAVTYCATWELDPDLKEYFYYEDGTAYETIDNVEGANFEVPADPYKVGYSFAGWTSTQGGTAAETLPSVMPDASTYYYAIFTPNSYDVIFDADGGMFDNDPNSVSKTVTSVFDSAIVLPADPTREGYTFQGWATTAGQQSGSTDLGNLTVETSEDEPLIYYAAWTVDSHTLTIVYEMADSHSELAPAQYEEDYNYGADYSVASPAVTGYTPDVATVSGTMGTQDVEVTVTYTPNDYTLDVTYVMSDGTTAPAAYTEQVAFNTAYSVASPAVTGYTPDTATVEGTMDDVNGKSVTVTYTPVKYTLTVNYAITDSHTELLPETHTEQVDFNASYNVESPAIAGYEADVAAVTGTMDDTNGKEVTVTYSPVAYTLTVNYVMSDGTAAPTADSALVPFNTTYNVTPPAVTGYTPDVSPVTGTMDVVGGKSVTVTYTPNAHTVTWVLDGGNIGGDTNDVVQNVVFGDAIVAPANPEKTGYTFTGWNPAVASTVADEDYTYTATYSANTYNATFKLEGGEVNGDTSDVVVPTAFDSAIVAPTGVDRAGYTFQGWSLTSAGAVLADLGNMDDVNGKTFYAVWTPDNASYYIDVYYMGTDGTYAAAQTYAGEDGKVTGDSVSVDPAVYAQEGFTLDAGNSTLSGEIPPTGELHLVVKFARDQHSITFISEGATVQTVTDVYYGVNTAALTQADVQKTGYTLAGWTATEGGTAAEVNPGADITMGTADLTYYAVWTPNQVNITVHEKYINLINNTETVVDKAFTGTADAHAYIVQTAGADATAKYILFSELDQVLATNYAIDPDNANNVLDGAIAADGSLELTVWYSPVSKTVTYNPNGGAFPAGTSGLDQDGNLVETYTYYDEVTASSVVPVREGYDFLGWARTASSAVANFTGIPHIAADTLVYAVWSEYKTVTVTYVMSDGSEAPAQAVESVARGAQYSIASPAVTGYTPDTAAVEGTMPADNVTATVTYTPNEYTLAITYVMSDNTEAPAAYSQAYAYNSAYSVASPAVTGYTADVATVEGTMDDVNGKAVTVTYTPNEYTLTINYVDGNNAPVAPAYTAQVAFNAAYSVPSPAVTGYTLADSAQSTVSGTMNDVNGITVNVVYNINNFGLTINYLIDGTSTPVPGTTAYTADLNYGESYSVASPAPVGYHLVDAAQATVAGTMGTDAITVNVYYAPNEYTLTINYVDGEGAPVATAYTAQVAYGESYSVTSPDVENYRLDDEAQATVSGTMPADNVTVNVLYVLNNVTVEFRVPVRITAETNYGKLDYDNATVVNAGSTEYVVGSPIAVPSADDTAIEYYTFLGWTETPITGLSTGNADAVLVTPENADAAATYYAVYSRELVYLVSLDSTKSSIDRMGNDPGTWGSLFTTENFTLDNYKSATSYSLWFVHVTPNFRVTSTNNPYTRTFFGVNGDGEITVVQGAGGYGTGTLIKVTDKVTGEVVEEFYVSIYGDVNGDTRVNGTDLTALYDAYMRLNGVVWATRNNYDHSKIMASNLNAPNRLAINGADYTALSDVVLGHSTIDPLTGAVTAAS